MRQTVVMPLPDVSKLAADMPSDGSAEAVEVFVELERRRALHAEGKTTLLTEEESWRSIRAAGYDV